MSFDTENNISINVIGSDLNLPPKKIANFEWCENQTYVLHDTLRPLNNGSESGFHRILRLKSSEREILDIENPSEYCFFVAVTADRILISLAPRLVDNLIRLRQLKVVDSDVRDFTLKPNNGFFAVTRGTALRIITKRNPEAFEPSHFGVGVSSLKMLSGLESPSNIEDQLRFPGEIGRNFIHGCFFEFGQMAVKLSGMDSFLSAIIVKNVAQEYGYLNRVRAVHVEMDEHYLGGYQKLIVEEMVRYLGVELEVIRTQKPNVERIAKAGRNSGYESAVRLEDWPVDCPATAALIDWEAQQTDTLILGGGVWSARVEPFQSFNGTLEF